MKKRGWLYLYLQELAWLVTILSFLGGIAIFLFKKIVIEPLQKAINALNDTLAKFEKTTNRQLDLLDKEIDLLKIKTTRHEEQIKTLFERER